MQKNNLNKSIRLDTTRWAGDKQRIEQEIKIWPYEHMVHAQPRIRPRKWDAENFSVILRYSQII